MKNTKQRQLVLIMVNNSYNHINANEVYLESKKINSNISLGTVYRNLNYLVESRIIRRLKMFDNTDRFDKNIVRSHIICNKYGKIGDVYYEYIEALPILKIIMY